MHNQPREPQPYEDCQAKSIQEFGWTSQGMDWGWGQDIKSTTHRRVEEFGYSCRQRRLTWAKEKKNWTVAQWSKVLFSDESKFCISFGNQGLKCVRDCVCVCLIMCAFVSIIMDYKCKDGATSVLSTVYVSSAAIYGDLCLQHTPVMEKHDKPVCTHTQCFLFLSFTGCFLHHKSLVCVHSISHCKQSPINPR